MPLGVSLGVATLEGRMFVTLRYGHAQFGAEATGRFLGDFEWSLLERDPVAAAS